MKVYLFSDAVLLASKSLGRTSCKDFVLLADIEVIDSAPTLPIFGLKFIQQVRDSTWRN